MEIKMEKGEPAQVYMPSYMQNYPPPPPYNVSFPHPQPVPEMRDEGWCMRNQKNKPQSNSAAGASLVFISGGMNIAWSFGYGLQYANFTVTTHIQISWFIGAILGALVSSILVGIVQKKLIMLFSSFLVVLSGIFFISMCDYPGAITAARYFDGIANGLVIVPIMMLVGEEAVKTMRGMLAATADTMMLSMGIYMQMIYSASWSLAANDAFNILELQGILALTYGTISFVIVYFLMVESPVFYLLRSDETGALDALRRLQRPFVVTQETVEQLEEHKRYVVVNNEMSFGESAQAGLPALLKMMVYRTLTAMTFSMFVSLYFMATTLTLNQSIYPTFSIWAVIVFGTCRWMGTLITAFLMDTVGRKKPMLFSSLVAGGFAFGLAAVTPHFYFFPQKDAALYLFFVFQLFAGVFASTASAYMTEAFPLKVKPFYVAIVYITEMLVQVIIAVCDFSFEGVAIYFYILGTFLIIFFGFGIMCLPETKQTTLREAQSKFRNFISS